MQRTASCWSLRILSQMPLVQKIASKHQQSGFTVPSHKCSQGTQKIQVSNHSTNTHGCKWQGILIQNTVSVREVSLSHATQHLCCPGLDTFLHENCSMFQFPTRVGRKPHYPYQRGAYISSHILVRVHCTQYAVQTA